MSAPYSPRPDGSKDPGGNTQDSGHGTPADDGAYGSGATGSGATRPFLTGDQGSQGYGAPAGGQQYGGSPYGGSSQGNSPYGGSSAQGGSPYGSGQTGGQQYGGASYSGSPYGGGQTGGQQYGGSSYSGSPYGGGQTGGGQSGAGQFGGQQGGQYGGTQSSSQGAWQPGQGPWRPAGASTATQGGGMQGGAPYGSPQYGGPGYGAGAPQGPGGGQTSGRNVVGIVGLVVAILGTILSCVPGVVIVGWVLLPIGFILGLVGLFMNGKPKGTAIAAVIMSIVGTIIAVIAFIAIIGTAFEDAFGGGEVTVSQPDGGAPAAGLPGGSSDGGDGSRENPSAIGDTLKSDEWEIVVNSFTRDATDQVMAANMFNDPPPPGSQHALVNLTVTHLGEGSEHVQLIPVAFVTDEGNVIQTFDTITVAPDPLEGELYTGASATGNVSLTIPENARGVLRVDLGVFGKEVFVSVE